jgi:uncharacterized protein YoxC
MKEVYMPEIEERIESLETLLGRFILHTDMALNRLSREVDRVSKEVDRVSKEVDRVSKEVDRVSKEVDRVSKEVDRVSKEVERVSNNVDKLSRENAAYREEARQERIEMNKRWGELANKMGTLVEDMVAPNIKGIAKKYFGCDEFEDFMIRRKKRHSKDRTRRREFDIIALCDESVIVNETKSTPRISYIDDFIATLKEFFDYFPEYEGKKIIPIFASLYLSDEVISYLTENHIYAMAIKEDTMDLLNYEALHS